MDEKTLEAILLALGRIEDRLNTLTIAVDKNIADLAEFSERFDEVVTQLEAERRLDWQSNFN